MSVHADKLFRRVCPPSARVAVGVGRRDITPPVGIYARHWGAAAHDVAEGVHRPLCATAMAIRTVGEASSRRAESGEGLIRGVGGESSIRGSGEAPSVREGSSGQPLVLVVIDAGWWQRPEDEWHVRGALLDALGLDAARVMLSCTHTHAGASLCAEDADKPGGHLIGPYRDALRDAVIAAAREALDRAAPAVLTWGVGRCDLAANRDLRDPERDRILCGWNPEGRADDTMLVGRVVDDAGRIVATLVNYACHPTTLAWENRLISPDYVGALREIFEGRTGGAPCLFLQGASGELAPREQYTGDPAIADANGRRAGLAAMAVLEGMLPPATGLEPAGAVESGAPLAVWKRASFAPSTRVEAGCFDVPLPLKPLPSRAELEAELAACTDRTMAERLRRRLRVVRQVGEGRTFAVPVWIWRIGDAALVGQMNEAYSVFQQALRERFPRHAVAVMNLVNGTCGYLTPPEAHGLNLYQVWQSPFDREALPALIDACIEHLGAMLPDDERGA